MIVKAVVAMKVCKNIKKYIKAGKQLFVILHSLHKWLIRKYFKTLIFYALIF